MMQGTSFPALLSVAAGCLAICFASWYCLCRTSDPVESHFEFPNKGDVVFYNGKEATVLEIPREIPKLVEADKCHIQFTDGSRAVVPRTGLKAPEHHPGTQKLLKELEAREAPCAPYNGDITLMTFNILARMWEDESDDTEKVRNPKILNYIDGKSPDVLFLQEAQKTTVDFILKGLNEKASERGETYRYTVVAFPYLHPECWKDWLPYSKKEWQPNGQAILMKQKLLKSHVVRIDTFDVSIKEDDDPAYRFNIPAVTIKMLQQQTPNRVTKDVCFINVHLWCGFFGGERRIQFKKIKQWINERRGKQFDHVVISGDFNDVSGSLLKAQEGTFRNHGEKYPGGKHPDTCANPAFSVRIDHVISDYAIKCVKYDCPNLMPKKGCGFSLCCGSPFNKDSPWFSPAMSRTEMIEKFGSDHLPITSTVRLGENTNANTATERRHDTQTPEIVSKPSCPTWLVLAVLVVIGLLVAAMWFFLQPASASEDDENEAV